MYHLFVYFNDLEQEPLIIEMCQKYGGVYVDKALHRRTVKDVHYKFSEEDKLQKTKEEIETQLDLRTSIIQIRS